MKYLQRLAVMLSFLVLAWGVDVATATDLAAQCWKCVNDGVDCRNVALTGGFGRDEECSWDPQCEEEGSMCQYILAFGDLNMWQGDVTIGTETYSLVALSEFTCVGKDCANDALLVAGGPGDGLVGVTRFALREAEVTLKSIGRVAPGL